MGFFSSAGVMLVQVFFGIVLLILALRLALPLTRVRFNNPLCQFVYKVTNPVIGPLTGLIPSVRRVSLATLLVAWLVALLEMLLLFLLVGLPLLPGALLAASLGGLAYYLLGVAFWAVVIRAIMSFFSPDPRNPAVEVLIGLTDPVVQPFRRLPPRTAPFDLSPLYACLALRLGMLAIAHLLGPLSALVLLI